jgi:hypothetical protein
MVAPVVEAAKLGLVVQEPQGKEMPVEVAAVLDMAGAVVLGLLEVRQADLQRVLPVVTA